MNHARILFCILMILLPFKARAVTVNADFPTVNAVPITISGYTATGNNLAVTLGFEPAAGTQLTVVNNTGTSFINGQFGNLSQGQLVTLAHDGITYKFVADYHGGTGNDLVLHWVSRDISAWGNNVYGQIGNDDVSNSNTPTSLAHSGVLNGKTIVLIAAGGSHSLALCSDGTLAAWGDNSYGQLGIGSASNSKVPVLASGNGVLFGKTITSISAGGYHSLALCSDGTLAAWGWNNAGQLGDGSTTNSNTPILVSRMGVLSGKTIIAISAGAFHSLALCSDGTLAAWGDNLTGQLGNGSTTDSNVPVLVTRTGVLSGKTIVSISANGLHSLALCSDGTLASWGRNESGELGNGNMTNSNTPVLVNRAGVLSGKNVTIISAGGSHNLVLCSDGTLVSWGDNDTGELGNGNNSNSSLPVLVNRTGVLSGKTVTAISAGGSHSLALCSDGTLSAWGRNSSGELGVGNSTNSDVPLSVIQSGVLAGETPSVIAAGGAHSIAISSILHSSDLIELAVSAGTLSPAFSSATRAYTVSATDMTSALTVTPTANDSEAAIRVNGTFLFSGSSSEFIPLSVGDNTITVEVTTRDGMITKNYILSVTRSPSAVATLSGLAPNLGILSPTFSATELAYTASVPNNAASISLTPIATDPAAVIKVNGTVVASGANSLSIPLSVGINTITIVVTAQDGSTMRTYTVKITRAASSVATLSALALKGVILSPTFNKSKTEYTAKVAKSTTSLKVRATATSNDATIKVNGISVDSGALSKPFALKLGKNSIKVMVTAQNGTTKTYKITVTRGSVVKSVPFPGIFQSPIQNRGFLGNPNTSRALVDGQTYLQLTLKKETGTPNCVIEVSPNLVDWFSGEKHTTTLVESQFTLQVRDNTPIKSGARRYIRIRQIP